MSKKWSRFPKSGKKVQSFCFDGAPSKYLQRTVKIKTVHRRNKNGALFFQLPFGLTFYFLAAAFFLGAAGFSAAALGAAAFLGAAALAGLGAEPAFARSF